MECSDTPNKAFGLEHKTLDAVYYNVEDIFVNGFSVTKEDTVERDFTDPWKLAEDVSCFRLFTMEIVD